MRSAIAAASGFTNDSEREAISSPAMKHHKQAEDDDEEENKDDQDQCLIKILCLRRKILILMSKR